MKVLGIDCSTKAIALVLLKDGEVADVKMIVANKGYNELQRLIYFASETNEYVNSVQPDAVAIEQAVYWKNYESTRKIIEVITAVKLALVNYHPETVNNRVWKKATVGYGNAPKTKILAYAQSKSIQITNQDLADSYCIAEYLYKKYSKKEEKQ